jgi:hypothetical protein
MQASSSARFEFLGAESSTFKSLTAVALLPGEPNSESHKNKKARSQTAGNGPFAKSKLRSFSGYSCLLTRLSRPPARCKGDNDKRKQKEISRIAM